MTDVAVKDSILNSTKKFLGIDASYDVYDIDIMLHINSVFSTLQQLGVGLTSEQFMIEDADTTWDEAISTQKNIAMIKSYMYLRVRLMFDPLTTGFATDSFDRQIKEMEWRINVATSSTPNVEGDTTVTPVTPEEIAAAVEDYLEEHPVSADEPLLEEHLADPTPHPPYDDLVNGRFTTQLENGMA